jgi:hypothetical protein
VYPGDRFVFVHQPKTGGTFVTSCLERLLGPVRPPGPLDRLRARLAGVAAVPHKHGTCNDIPPSHRGKQVVSVVRNPFDRYVSQYEYAWWKSHERPWRDAEALRARWPSWPDLSFPEFVVASGVPAFRRLRGWTGSDGDAPGLQAEQFVRFYFREPERAVARMDDAYLAARAFEADMHPVRFLRMESLNADLHAFLREQGHAAERIAWILEEGKILPEGSRRGERPWQEYFTPELAALVRRRDRLLFALFPWYDGTLPR